MSTDYLTVATAQLNRGFKVVPVHPLTKCGVLWNQYRQPATTLSEVQQHAKDFPTHNVGIVGVRGIGNHCFLDIDADGVIERIETESRHKMPVTYTVSSSPAHKPWKRHFYFLQTEHSVSTFKRQFNRRDTTKTVTSDKGTVMNPTEYDFKGVGSGGFVVAAGCTRKDGERYTILQDAPVIPIPDWLVDWLVADRERCKSELAKARQAQAQQAASMPNDSREVLKARGDPAAFDVEETDIYDFILSRAGTLASIGLGRKMIEKCLIELVPTFCAGGTSYVKEHRETIHKVAFSKRLRIGNAKWFRRMGPKKRMALREGTSGFVQTRKSLLIEAMRKFPDMVTAETGYERLRKALAGTPFKLTKGKTSQKALAEVRDATGFTTARTSQGWVWVRSRDTHSSLAQVTYSDMTSINNITTPSLIV
jgi:hypothetical protein